MGSLFFTQKTSKALSLGGFLFYLRRDYLASSSVASVSVSSASTSSSTGVSCGK